MIRKLNTAAFSLLLLLVACTTGGSADRAIPFTAAEVHGDGTAYTVTWTAPGIQSVRVYAGTDAAHVGDDHTVGRGGASGSVDVSGLPAAPRWYFALVPDRGAPLTIAGRSLHLATAPNFRAARGCLRPRALDIRERGLDTAVEIHPCRCRLNAARRPVNQADAEVLLQGRQRPADRLERAAEARRRFRQAPAIHDGDKCFIVAHRTFSRLSR